MDKNRTIERNGVSAYKPEMCEAIIRYGREGLLPVQWVDRLNTDFPQEKKVTYAAIRNWKHHTDYFISEFQDAWDEAMAHVQSSTLTRMEKDPAYFQRGKWKMSAYLGVVEKKMLESHVDMTAEMNVKGSLEIRESFADRAVVE